MTIALGAMLLERARRGVDGVAMARLGSARSAALRKVLDLLHIHASHGHTQLNAASRVRQEDATEAVVPQDGLAAAAALADAAEDAESDRASSGSDGAEALRPRGIMRLVSWARRGAVPASAYVLTREDDGIAIATARAWSDEERLAELLAARVTAPAVSPESGLPGVIGPALDDLRARAQLDAIQVALARSLLILTGGPGTGKTRTIARIVAACAERHIRSDTGRQRPPFRAALVAPTGKAAARLADEVARLLRDDSLPEPLRRALHTGVESGTIHRILGWQPRLEARFRHHAQAPLAVDLVVVDECSMADLSLMRRLVEAVPPEATLVLAGDGNQLLSVEAGSVFGDLCSLASHPRLGENVVRLKHNFRTEGNPRADALQKLADAVNDGRVDDVLAALPNLIAPADSLTHQVAAMATRLFEGCQRQAAESAEAALRALAGFRVLGAHRVGDGGVERVALAIDRELSRRFGELGRQVMILENDAELELFNGDMAVAVGAAAGPLSYCVGLDRDGSPRLIPPSGLPRHEPAWAISIHKSQGSEYERVLIVLPPRDSPILSRQLLYTAITRSRGEVEIVATPESIRWAVERQARRDSGLASALQARLPH